MQRPFIRLAEPRPLPARSSSMKHSAAANSFDTKTLSALGNGEVGYIKPICNEADYIQSFFPKSNLPTAWNCSRFIRPTVCR